MPLRGPPGILRLLFECVGPAIAGTLRNFLRRQDPRMGAVERAAHQTRRIDLIVVLSGGKLQEFGQISPLFEPHSTARRARLESAGSSWLVVDAREPFQAAVGFALEHAPLQGRFDRFLNDAGLPEPAKGLELSD